MAENTQTERDVRGEIVAASREAVKGLTEKKALLYSRLMLGKATVAYIWAAGKGATRVDLYVPEASLPKSITAFDPKGRGRARKDGLVATLTGDPSQRDLEQVVEGIKIAAEAASRTGKDRPERPSERAMREMDEVLADQAKAPDKAKPDPKPKSGRKSRSRAKASSEK